MVEPDSAMSVTTALRIEAALTMSDGFRSSQTISTMRRPAALAMRACSASTAGIELAPGRLRPRTSTSVVIVEAVPMVLQVPVDRTLDWLRASHSSRLSRPAR